MDDKTKRTQEDRDRVNVHEDYELNYWTKRFHVSPEQLRAAVGKVGPTVKELEKHFANH